MFGTVETPGIPADATGANGYIYIVDNDHVNDVCVLFVVEPVAQDNLQIKAELPLPYSCKRISIDGSYAYITGTTGLTIVDISDYENPGIVNTVDTGYSSCITIACNYAFLRGYEAGVGYGLFVVDIFDPLNADVVDSLLTASMSSISDIVINGNYAYIAGYDRGLRIIELF